MGRKKYLFVSNVLGSPNIQRLAGRLSPEYPLEIISLPLRWVKRQR
jgi:hypothetical protein